MEKDISLTKVDNRCNMFRITGRVVHKNYSPGSKSLFLVVSVHRVDGRAYSDTKEVDFPAFVLNGKKAEELNAEIEKGDRISFDGHFETGESLRPQGHGLYRKVYDLKFVVDAYYLNINGRDSNEASLEGEVIRVYRNAEKGKRYYIITIRSGSEAEDRVAFTYFDHDMTLEPKKGDRVWINGRIRTKTLSEDEAGGRRTYLSSIVANNVRITRK